MNHNPVVSLPVGVAALTAHQRVTLSSGLVVAAGADANFIGHVLQDVAAGGQADVILKWRGGFVYAIAAGAIAAGATVQGAAAGKIATGGTEGFALSAASGNNSIIRVLYSPAAA